MGEIRVKSGNLVESYVTERYQSRFSGVLYAELDLKKDTTYTIALNLNNGYEVYINEHIFTVYTEITGDDTVKILSVKTKSDLEKKATNYTDGKGWLLLKNAINESDYISVADFQILEGTYTSETIPPYQPYFLNLPSHQKTPDGWKDIPTHTMTATGWQGELTSQSPLEFKATGQSLLDWRIDGKTSENLFDINRLPSDTWTTDTRYYMNGGIVTSKVVNPTAVTISVNNDTLSVTTVGGNGAGFLVGVKPSTEYRFAFIKSESLASDKTSCTYAFVDTSETIGQLQAIYGNDDGVVFTTDSNTKYVYFVFRKAAGTISYSNIMLNEGNTALPYERYGGVGDWDETEQQYKIPVTVNDTTTNLYTDHQLMDGDSMDYTTDQTTIPITQGDNVLAVETAVQPKSVFVKFEG